MPGKGWIGVDLDGTLAYFDRHSSIASIGKPIEPMLVRVMAWLQRGIEVRIVTARVAAYQRSNDDGVVDSTEFAETQRKMITEWCLENIGVALESTATKDFQMIQLWDDRCVQVISNTGLAIEVSS